MHGILRKVWLVSLLVCAPIYAQTQTNSNALADLEKASGGRLGVFAVNTANDAHVDYRGQERFAFCSTAKALAVAAILKRSMLDPNLLKKMIQYQASDVVPYSPVTEHNVAQGMSVADLCAAAIIQGDNTAMNLLVGELGGIQKLMDFTHSIGDRVFRLDRLEPDLNSAIPGDLRDTTTPAQMTADLRMLVLGDVLGQSQRQLLERWLLASTTGNARIRAGVPSTWRVGDRTGSCAYGQTNDVAVIWPTQCKPIVISIYLTQDQKDAPHNDAVLASATRIALNALASTDECLKRALSAQ